VRRVILAELFDRLRAGEHHNVRRRQLVRTEVVVEEMHREEEDGSEEGFFTMDQRRDVKHPARQVTSTYRQVLGPLLPESVRIRPNKGPWWLLTCWPYVEQQMAEQQSPTLPGDKLATPFQSVVYQGDNFPRRIRQDLDTPSDTNFSALCNSAR